MKNIYFNLYKNYKEASIDQFQKIQILVFGSFSLLVILESFYGFVISPMPIILLVLLGGYGYIKSYFTEIEHTKEFDGELVFSLDSIRWKDQSILWKDIYSIHLETDIILGDIAVGTRTKNKLSHGINSINLTAKYKVKMEGLYQITNASEIEKLMELFNLVIEQNDVKFDVAKKLVKPKNYAEMQELKERIIN